MAWKAGEEKRLQSGIVIKPPEQIAIMREAGKLTNQAHQVVRTHIRPGITTRELDLIIENFIRSKGAEPSFKGYHGFPSSSCISINDEMVHVIPGSRILKEGDIVSIDIGVLYKGYHGDMCWTYGVGEISQEAKRLLKVNERALWAGIRQARHGKKVYNIGRAMYRVAAQAGFEVSRQYGGHGVGKSLQEAPHVPNYDDPKANDKLRQGMVIAIEPIVCMGNPEPRTLDDEWSVVTLDGSLCSQFEHTVAIQRGQPIILTLP